MEPIRAVMGYKMNTAHLFLSAPSAGHLQPGQIIYYLIQINCHVFLPSCSPRVTVDPSSSNVAWLSFDQQTSPWELRRVLLGARRGLASLTSLPGSGLRALCPWLGQLGGQEHLLLILPAVQLVGDVLGGHPLGIFGVDGGPVLEQEAYTVRMAHERSHVQGCPAHGGAAETAGSCKIRKLPEGGTSRKRGMEGLRL